MAKPKLSVIIPTYNRAAYIAEAIDSVLVQDFGAYEPEILVIDDGSTDNTKEVLKKYKDKITFIELPHSGKPAVPRNYGLKMAAGELIAFQDSDDKWPKDKLENQLQVFDDKNIVMSYGQAGAMNSNGELINKLVVEPKILKYGESFYNLLKSNSISTLTVMARKDALLEVGGFNESDEVRAVEDYELWLRMSARYPEGIKAVDKTLAHYRQHDNNISTSDGLVATQRLISVFDTLWEVTSLNDQQRLALENQLGSLHKNIGILRAEKYGRPAISVVMGAYNAGKFLRPAVDSILHQTFHNFEFIIINDGSADDTVEILRSYDDPRMRIVNQVNHGLVYALNKGFDIAHAEYIARMDADDISLPSRFEKELQVITSAANIGVVGTFFSYIDEAHSSLSTTITVPTKHIDLVRSLYIVNPFGHGSTLIRKSAWKQAGGYLDSFGPTEDYDLWRRIADNWEFSVIPEALYWYRINPASISHLNREVQHKFVDQIVEEVWQKPFIRKGIRLTIADGRYYLGMDSPYSAHIYHQYLHQQVLIMRRLYKNRNFIAGLRTALPIAWLRPRLIPSVSRSTLGGFLHRIGLRRYG